MEIPWRRASHRRYAEGSTERFRRVGVNPDRHDEHHDAKAFNDTHDPLQKRGRGRVDLFAKKKHKAKDKMRVVNPLAGRRGGGLFQSKGY